jgi:uncharacterized Tic20 family protein
MRDSYHINKLLQSIKNGIWMIAAMLLIHLGLGLVGLRAAPIAEIIMILSFWGGLILFAFVFASVIVDIFRKPRSRNTQAEQDAP